MNESGPEHDFWAKVQEDSANYTENSSFSFLGAQEDEAESYSSAKRLKIWTPEDDHGMLSSTAASSYATSFTSLVSNPAKNLWQELSSPTCFGAICNAPVQTREHHSEPEICAESPTFYQFDLVPAGKTLSLQNDTGIDFAILNTAITRKLEGILEATQVRCKCFIQISEWSQHVQEQNPRSSALMTDINIYGPLEQSQVVAVMLSDTRLFLQQPRVILPHIMYQNPHFLSLSPNSGDDFILTTLYPLGDSSFRSKQQNDNEVEVDLQTILDTLPHRDFLLQQVPSSGQMTTKLLWYQKEAVDFIHLRETGTLPEELSLWQKHNNIDGPTYFQHLITRAKKREPDDTCGGILADEMGLGKTLVMLATIIQSQGRAWSSFCQQTNTHSGTKWATKGTLVIAPSPLILDSWIEQIELHTIPETLSWYRYHGQNRQDDLKPLLISDIILTTYSTIAADFCRGRRILDNISWFRIVLDEAHVIRNRSTKQYRAISAIPAQNRWCLTGTPIQNTLEDLGALVSFIRVPLLDDPAVFRKYIVPPPNRCTVKDSFSNLCLLLGSVCIRRTNRVLGTLEPTVISRKLHLSSREIESYSRITEDCKRVMAIAVSTKKGNQAKHTLLQTFLKLRLFCNNGQSDMNIYGQGFLPTDPDEALTFLQQQDKAKCAYCSCDALTVNGPKDSNTASLTDCYYLVCESCQSRHLSERRKARNSGVKCCHLCYKTTPKSSGADVELLPTATSLEDKARNDHLAHEVPTKLQALLNDIIEYRDARKSIVFSFWKTTLNIVAELLEKHGIQYCRIHGSMTLTERRKVLVEFKTSQTISILLMTLGTGAVGLNLTVASRIYLLEPQWNPFIESQAIGRALRLGQTQQVSVVRYIMVGTVEKAVEDRQKTKLQLAGSGFGKGKDEQAAERFKELTDLICTVPTLEPGLISAQFLLEDPEGIREVLPRSG